MRLTPEEVVALDMQDPKVAERVSQAGEAGFGESCRICRTVDTVYFCGGG